MPLNLAEKNKEYVTQKICAIQEKLTEVLITLSSLSLDLPVFVSYWH